MSRIRSTWPEDPDYFDDSQESIYSSGQCHVHAIAAARLHGTPEQEPYPFLIITDYSDTWCEDEDDFDNDVQAVTHVYSLHQVDGQTVARDVFGDRLEIDVLEEVNGIFGPIEALTEYGSLQDLLDLSGIREDGFEGPLSEVTEEDISAALMEPSVTAPLSLEPSITCEEEPAP